MVMSEKDSLALYEAARSKHEPAFIETGDTAAYKAAVDPLWDEHLKRTGQQVITAEPAAEVEDDEVEDDEVEAKPAPKARAKKAAAPAPAE